ncbi:hypothetical protein [Gluconobacter cerinus]|nr:hypothetical protein [Gluconobacter cerinus]MBS0983724.1 hypothetical protein [Gluconobacter cerinus]
MKEKYEYKGIDWETRELQRQNNIYYQTHEFKEEQLFNEEEIKKITDMFR